MAVRSGAGTGIVVALVVFVLTTVFLLVMTIVFYRGQTQARESEADAKSALARYIKPAQRNQDAFSTYEAVASQANQSVVEHLHEKYRDLMQAADGSATTTHEQFMAKVQRLGAGEDFSLFQIAARLDGSLEQTRTEMQSKDRRLAERDEEIASLQAEIDRLQAAQAQTSEQVDGQLEQYGRLVADYNQRLSDAITTMEESVQRLQSRYGDQVEQLENEKDQLSEQIVVMRSRLSEFQEMWDEIRARGKNPALLVDGRVIDTLGVDQVFIDKGRRDRIVRGMSFEVYDDELAIIDPVTNDIQPGKASLQVVKVGETTATCTITRSTPGRPVVRQDIVANAVYDPRHQFSFLVHGKFDIDGDGRPTEPEAEYLRSLVYDWNGRVVTGTELPGDLDFLVLGAQPPEPPPLNPDAGPIEMERWLRQKNARETYLSLFNQAREAQIPVLNANRFLILIGYSDR